MESKKYYKYIDIVRIISVIAILLYHLNILKGGYLAVCTFFVLTGYLSYCSIDKDENFSIIRYYINKVLKIYLPLLFIVSLTLIILSLFSNIFLLNLKPELTSILLGYNNFWQLSVNNDYFARQTTSPFIHLWYIAIILQYDLVFPFIYVILNKIKNKTHKIVPLILTLIFSFLSIIYFYQTFMNTNIMFNYYNTFTRIFSLLLGFSLGIMHSNSYHFTFKKNNTNKLVFYLYLFILILSFIFFDVGSSYYPLSMIVVTLISCCLIDYSVSIKSNKISFLSKIIKSLSNISYEIYLVQYPIMFFLENLNVSGYLYIISVIFLTVIISYIIHFLVTIKNKRNIILQYITFLIVFTCCLYGTYIYFITEDHTQEMQELEQQLARNEELIKENQANYELQEVEDNQKWQNLLKNFENYEEKIKEIVDNLSIVGIGDSVMLGAIPELSIQFSNGYFDAAVSRFTWDASKIIDELVEKNIFGNPVIIHLGTNGDCSTECKDKVMESIGNREVYWINTTNSDEVNENLVIFSKKYSNLHIIDWKTISQEHKEYFYADKIHLTPLGREAYTSVIYNAIYDDYLNKFIAEKNAIINEYEENKKSKISFYGNELLLNIYKYLDDDIKKSQFTINKEYDYNILKEKITKDIQENRINHNVVFMFDNNFSLSKDEYLELLDICNDYNVYFISSSIEMSDLFSLSNSIKTVDFYLEIQNNNNYIMADNIHLTELGNIELNNKLNNILRR